MFYKLLITTITLASCHSLYTVVVRSTTTARKLNFLTVKSFPMNVHDLWQFYGSTRQLNLIGPLCFPKRLLLFFVLSTYPQFVFNHRENNYILHLIHTWFTLRNSFLSAVWFYYDCFVKKTCQLWISNFIHIVLSIRSYTNSSRTFWTQLLYHDYWKLQSS